MKLALARAHQKYFIVRHGAKNCNKLLAMGMPEVPLSVLLTVMTHFDASVGLLRSEGACQSGGASP
jgi:hypothetical protein